MLPCLLRPLSLLATATFVLLRLRGVPFLGFCSFPKLCLFTAGESGWGLLPLLCRLTTGDSAFRSLPLLFRLTARELLSASFRLPCLPNAGKAWLAFFPLLTLLGTAERPLPLLRLPSRALLHCFAGDEPAWSALSMLRRLAAELAVCAPVSGLLCTFS